MLSPTYEITTALSHTDELISPPYDIAIVTISYGRVTMSSVWDSMMSKKIMGWPFYAAVGHREPAQLSRDGAAAAQWHWPTVHWSTDRVSRPAECTGDKTSLVNITDSWINMTTNRRAYDTFRWKRKWITMSKGNNNAMEELLSFVWGYFSTRRS